VTSARISAAILVPSRIRAAIPPRCALQSIERRFYRIALLAALIHLSHPAVGNV
jgi:hypothetical protein